MLGHVRSYQVSSSYVRTCQFRIRSGQVMSGKVISNHVWLDQIITMRVKSIHEKDRSYLVCSGKVRSGQVQVRSGLVSSGQSHVMPGNVSSGNVRLGQDS